MTGPKPKRVRRAPRQPSHVPPRMLDALDARDGHRSAWTGKEYVRGSDSDVLVPQHRQGGMGGRPGKHRLSNLVWIESELNGAATSDPERQAEAKRRGIAISLHADPRVEPVKHAVHGEVYLTDDGLAVPVREGVPV